MAETDVRDLSKQPTLSKYQPYLTYGLLAFIGGFAGLHTLYRTGKVSFFRTVLSGAFFIFSFLTTIGISMLFSCL